VVDGKVCKFTFVLPVPKSRSGGVTIHELVLWVVVLGVLCHGVCVCVCVSVMTLLSAVCG
jgi:hypothetical protein